MLPRHQDKEPVQRSPALICFRLVFFLLVLFAACSSGRQDDGENGGQQNERFFPAFSRPSTLQAIRTDSLDAPTLVMIQTLQGILAQSRPEIYIDEPGTGYSIWLRDLAENYGIDHTWHEDPWWFVDRYRDRLAAGGTYILYDMGEESENVATSLAGVLGSVAVASEIEAAAREHGLSPALDVRGRTERWLFENYSGALNRDFYLFQRTSSNGSLREYPAATNSFLFHMDCLLQPFRDWVRPARYPFPVIGWAGRADRCLFEHDFVLPFTEMGGFVLPSDRDKNLSTLSGVSVPMPLRQKGHSRLEMEDDVHYVTFVVSDGDNKGWVMRGFATNERLFASPRRGEFNVGWTLPPLLSELAPSVLAWIYENGAVNPGRDFFIAGVSGIGYMYPGFSPDLEGYGRRMGPYLEATDLHIVNIMLFVPDHFRPEVIRPYTQQPQVQGCLAINYALGYDLLEGKIVWAAGKPAVGARYAMCKDCSITGKAPEAIAWGINALPADPRVPEGYSFVIVQPWSYGLDDIAACIASLNPNVRVVTPEGFIQAVTHFQPGADTPEQ